MSSLNRSDWHRRELLKNIYYNWIIFSLKFNEFMLHLLENETKEQSQKHLELKTSHLNQTSSFTKNTMEKTRVMQ